MFKGSESAKLLLSGAVFHFDGNVLSDLHQSLHVVHGVTRLVLWWRSERQEAQSSTREKLCSTSRTCRQVEVASFRFRDTSPLKSSVRCGAESIKWFTTNTQIRTATTRKLRHLYLTERLQRRRKHATFPDPLKRNSRLLNIALFVYI